MTKKKGKLATSQRENWILFLSSVDTAMKLYQVSSQDFTPTSPAIRELMTTCARLLDRSITTVAGFLCEVHRSSVYQKKVNPSYKAILHFKSMWKENLDHANNEQHISHWQKRRRVYELGIKLSPFWGRDLLSLTESQRPFRVRLIERKRTQSPIKLRQVISEFDFPGRTGLLVNETEGYYVVGVDESVLFYSWDVHGTFTPELAVIRGVARSASFSDAFYAWLEATVIEACGERRNVRPNHPGHMAQVGLNNGPWHARVIGPAVSYTKHLDAETRGIHDRDIIGAVSITWSIIRSVMPREILEHVDSRLEKYSLPRLATRDVAPGYGFNIQIGETEYGFPTAERAPPEAYLSRNYEAWLHTDAAYCDWAFALCAARGDNPQLQKTSHPESRMKTRSSTRQNTPLQTFGPNILDGGGSITDASLRVVVRQAQGTVTAFKPGYPHGTSMLNGSSNTIISIGFAGRVGEAWMQAQAQDRIIIQSGPGAGEGNTVV